MVFADRLNLLGTEGAFEVLGRARALEAQGKNVIHLEIGEPDFETPPHVAEAGIEAIRAGKTHYGPTAGIPELREAIISYVKRTRGIDYSLEEVMVTPGAKPIIFYTIMALLEPGDEAIYPDPGFPIYDSVIRFAGGKPVPLPLTEAQDFRFTAEALRERITPRTKLLILNSPNNPCGSMLTPSDLTTIAELAQKHNFWVLSDEIYSRIVYEGEFHSPAELDGMKERTIMLDGFSKTYAMTGWRLGYGLMPKALADKIALLVVNTNSCTATFTQVAGAAALNGPQTEAEAMLAEFTARRELVVKGLNAIPGVSCRYPAGAFYAFPNISSFGRTSKEIADYLLTEANVALLRGTSFGAQGEGFLRISYASSRPVLEEALVRIREALARL